MLYPILRTFYSLQEILTILLHHPQSPLILLRIPVLPQQSVTLYPSRFRNLFPSTSTSSYVSSSCASLARRCHLADHPQLIHLSYRTTTSESNKLAQHALHLRAHAATCAVRTGVLITVNMEILRTNQLLTA
jgi:hypothetical protein